MLHAGGAAWIDVAQGGAVDEGSASLRVVLLDFGLLSGFLAPSTATRPGLGPAAESLLLDGKRNQKRLFNPKFRALR
jgi:hypothetical protein